MRKTGQSTCEAICRPGMLVSLEAIFLSTFVLMKQNRIGKRADSRGHLDLRIHLLVAKEMTMVLQMLRQIGARVGVRDRKVEREQIEEKLYREM